MIYICADDYGLSEKTCNRIEMCIGNGALNKISVLPNGEITDWENRFSDKNLMISLHINLVEGKPLSNPDKINLLVSDKGCFRHSFGGLLSMSVSPKRKEFEKQLYEEVRNQLKFCKSIMGTDTSVAIDSHQHVHMIPLIFNTLMRAIKDENLNVSYLRIPSEPLMPYLMTPSLYHTYNPVNIIKQWLLKFFSFVNKKEFDKSGIKSAYFMGVLFSGKMDEKRVNKVLQHYVKLADKNNRDIELLFHPGYLENGDELFDENKKSFNKFYLSKGRRIEFDTLMKRKSQINNKKEECEHAIY